MAALERMKRGEPQAAGPVESTPADRDRVEIRRELEILVVVE